MYKIYNVQYSNIHVIKNYRNKMSGSDRISKSCKPLFRCKNKPTMAHRNLEKLHNWMFSELELELSFLNSKACKLLW